MNFTSGDLTTVRSCGTLLTLILVDSKVACFASDQRQTALPLLSSAEPRLAGRGQAGDRRCSHFWNIHICPFFVESRRSETRRDRAGEGFGSLSCAWRNPDWRTDGDTRKARGCATWALRGWWTIRYEPQQARSQMPWISTSLGHLVFGEEKARWDSDSTPCATSSALKQRVSSAAL